MNTYPRANENPILQDCKVCNIRIISLEKRKSNTPTGQDLKRVYRKIFSYIYIH